MFNKIKELERNHKSVVVIETIVLLLLVAFMVVQIAFPHVLYQAKYMAQLKEDEDYRLINEDYNLYSVAKLTDEQLEIYESYIAYEFQNLPLYMNDYQIIIVDDDMETKNPYTNQYTEEGYIITAKTSKGMKTILLHKNHIAASLAHEIGHAVDNTYKFSKTKEFKAIYKNATHDDYLNSDIAEYFADGYDRFVNWDMNQDTEQELIEYYENILGQKYMEVQKNRIS